MKTMLRRILRVLSDPGRAKRAIMRRLPNVVHVGPRAMGKRSRFEGNACFRKTLCRDAEGMAAIRQEVLARELFDGSPWMTPILERGEDWISLPFLPEEARLDRVAPTMNEASRMLLAKQAVSILFDIFLKGYAHRDFHAKNLFWLEDQLLVTDFELIKAYPAGTRPAFPESYDITGRGLESPFASGYVMSYSRATDESSSMALENVLGIPVTTAMEELRKDLKGRLQRASNTFRSREGRHDAVAGRVYGSFSLPHLVVTREESQRDSSRRLERLGVRGDVLAGKSLLDLGSNIGAMCFEAQRLGPGRCLGVEYDRENVDLAARVAAFNGLSNLTFVQGDIDRLDAKGIGGPFDVVFCLSVEAHVKKKTRLYQLLSELTAGTLYFEGNRTSDPGQVKSSLLSSGFRRVETLGFCDDDCKSANNRRPLLVGYK